MNSISKSFIMRLRKSTQFTFLLTFSQTVTQSQSCLVFSFSFCLFALFCLFLICLLLFLNQTPQ